MMVVGVVLVQPSSNHCCCWGSIRVGQESELDMAALVEEWRALLLTDSSSRGLRWPTTSSTKEGGGGPTHNSFAFDSARHCTQAGPVPPITPLHRGGEPRRMQQQVGLSHGRKLLSFFSKKQTNKNWQQINLFF